jgi:predicted O-linked N-acetylglucosamine transferase (SPINDLY family)
MEPFSYLLAFARLAPIQLTSFGHPDTTGIPNVDYFVSSALYETKGAADHYTEQLVQIPDAGTLAYYYKPSPPTGPVARSEFGLPDDAPLYFCPQTLFKMHPDMDIVFLSILDRDPLAVIVLIEPVQVHMRQALEKRWRDAGGKNLDRIRFVERMPHADYLRLMSCADVMLDTVHFNGQNTNLEAFALGIPVVTLPGVMQRERHTLGMYKAMDIEDFNTCIASDPADYAQKAVEIANNADLRSTLRKLILDRSSTLYENISIVRALEKSLIEMVRALEETSRSTPL